MKKILFACDLDNTLVHSYKHRQTDDLCIELINNREQGFIPNKSSVLLEKVIKRVMFLPITTRSLEQYRRIKWPTNCVPQNAITTNGGILLENDTVDNAWYTQSLQHVSDYHSEIERLRSILGDEKRIAYTRTVDDCYLYGYCTDESAAVDLKTEYEHTSTLNIISSGKKIYFLPPLMNKGEALKRFLLRCDADIIVSAGDSLIDVPMLNHSDITFIPNHTLAPLCQNADVRICPSDTPFSEFILTSILQLCESC